MRALDRAWEQLHFKTPLDFIEAATIKQVTGREPRLMAKFDHQVQLPPALAQRGCFLLPVRNGRYAIVKGEGYHRLEPCPEPVDFPSRANFALKTLDQGISEMQHLDLAYNCGMLSAFLGERRLFPTVRGRKRSPAFELEVGDFQLSVKGVQVEVDAGYESSASLTLFEAKIGEPEDFHIRQLYYPFRFWSLASPKPVRNVFFTYEPQERVYRLREYRFEPAHRYGRPRLVKAAGYRLVERPSHLRRLPSSADTRVPQANDLTKVGLVPFLVAEGFDDAHKLARAFEFTPRQSGYYREAAQLLGLLGAGFVLSDRGRLFLELEVEERHELMARAVFELPLFRQLLVELLLSRDRRLTREEVMEILRLNSELSDSTLKRRCATVWSWLSWISETVGGLWLNPAQIRLQPAQQAAGVQLSLFGGNSPL